MGNGLHPLGQDRDAVVDAREEQQQRVHDEHHLVAALDVEQGRMAAIMPMPTIEAEPMSMNTAAVPQSAPLRSMPKNRTSTVSTTAVWMKP